MIAVTDAGGSGRLDERNLQSGATPTDGSLALTVGARGVAIDGRHSAVVFTTATAVVTQLETVPDLGARIQLIFEDRLCVTCHTPDQLNPPNQDFTSADDAFTSLVGVTAVCDGLGLTRVVAGDSAVDFMGEPGTDAETSVTSCRNSL